MRSTSRLLVAGLVALLGGAVVVPAAQAQSTRTFVASYGDDAQPCSRTAPCRTFATAFDRTATNGEINVIDTGSYGPITITRSMKLRGRGTIAGVIVNAGSAITVNAGASDRVMISGLDINGLTTGTNGIRVLQAGKVTVDDVQIFGFTFAGVAFQPANAGARLAVTRSTFYDNRSSTGATGSAIVVEPTGVGTARATVSRTEMHHNDFGVAASGTTQEAVVNVSRSTISDSVAGIFSSGAGALVRISSTDVLDSQFGLFSGSGGQVISSGNNNINGNAINGTPTSITPLT
ncbi:MAG: hypothetical protein WC558_07365 [Patulibacter sp.]